jgi:hypothetical protein
MHAFSAFAPVSSVTITVQAPQSPSLQPSLVPVSPRSTRNQSKSVVVGDTSTSTVSPFRENLTVMKSPAALPEEQSPKRAVDAA